MGLILLLPNMVTAIEKIIQLQPFLGIAVDNQYVFAVKGNKNMHIEGHKAMKAVAGASKVNIPTAFTATSLRKYIAIEVMYLEVPEIQRRM